MKTKRTVGVKTKSLPIDIVEANELLGTLSALERIEWAVNTFDSGLYTLTSAGIDSALILEHIAQTGHPIPVIHINTGFLPPETLAFRNDLELMFGFRLFEFGPSKKQIADITARKLWDKDLPAYSRITKLDPLTKAIKKLDVKAILTGVRGDQTNNRASLSYIGLGNDGEIRIRPFIDWPATKVASYIDSHGLPRNPLHNQGFGSVGDRYTTMPGKAREGRMVMECGLHVVDGKPLKQKVI